MGLITQENVGGACRGTFTTPEVSFARSDDGLIWRRDYITGDHAFEPKRLCIPQEVLGDMMEMVHNDGHPGFTKLHEVINLSWIVKGLAKKLREFLMHCPSYQVFQTRRHQPYSASKIGDAEKASEKKIQEAETISMANIQTALQPIESPPVPFHTLTLDFVLDIPVSGESFDTVLTVTDKFSKRVTLIVGVWRLSGQKTVSGDLGMSVTDLPLSINPGLCKIVAMSLTSTIAWPCFMCGSALPYVFELCRALYSTSPKRLGVHGQTSTYDHDRTTMIVRPWSYDHDHVLFQYHNFPRHRPVNSYDERRLLISPITTPNTEGARIKWSLWSSVLLARS